MKILVTGSKGQLGYEIINMVEDDEVVGIDKDDLDITDINKTYELIKEIKPDVVIHCAAYTNVDGAERDIDMAYKVNVIGAQNIASACLNVNSKMVYVSTDFVFDGTKNEPYIEFDIPNPLSVYGKSKLAGELIVKDILSKHFIVRTAWLYGKNGNNFVKTMLKLSKEKDVIKVVNDQWGTPTSTVDLSRAILDLIKTDAYGTYHGSNKGQTTWYEFTKKIFEISGINTRIEPISTEELGRPAARPKYSVMRNYMLELTIGDNFRDWEESLRDYLKA
ncbi:dTDP-4-dehydrorhamnose reductase [Fonticella tunisiensis]|uniref:dTDP-4-dehydrorhamnose reductase n=1 Tax=Fonticella tunisiensis TaxID=1096341 RepID=A0A4R7KC05_9CLOT|nr:dTDP-4-dehydrorhamnose reductase [Fonticella tunisiensis]TDT52016.1 dTDP-4-dehydrorhamnose reductase [Fonticella tunisiensis]